MTTPPGKPKFSIITICRNESTRIIPTCESITSQTCKDYEWIVIDGASTDDTLGLLEKYKPHITTLVSEPDNGIYDAMNKGIRLAGGEFLIFMNGGDSFHSPTVLEQVAGGRMDADILYGGSQEPATNGGIRISVPPEKVNSPLFFISENLQHQATFIRRTLFERYGGYDTRYKIVSDWRHWIVFAFNGCKFRRVDVCVADFAPGGMSMTQKDLVTRERMDVLREFYCPADYAGLAREKHVSWVKLFGFLPLLKTIHRKGKKTYLLFGFLPLLSITQRI